MQIPFFGKKATSGTQPAADTTPPLGLSPEAKPPAKGWGTGKGNGNGKKGAATPAPTPPPTAPAPAAPATLPKGESSPAAAAGHIRPSSIYSMSMEEIVSRNERAFALMGETVDAINEKIEQELAQYRKDVRRYVKKELIPALNAEFLKWQEAAIDHKQHPFGEDGKVRIAFPDRVGNIGDKMARQDFLPFVLETVDTEVVGTHPKYGIPTREKIITIRMP